MRFAALAADRFHRAIASAHRAAGADFLGNFIADQCPAYFCGAAFFVDVRLVFVAEVLERAHDRVGGALSQAAQAGALDLDAQLFEQFDIAWPTLAAADALQDL